MKENDNNLLYVALGIGALVLFMRNKQTPSPIAPASLLPASTNVHTNAVTTTATNPISQLANAVTKLFKGGSQDTPNPANDLTASSGDDIPTYSTLEVINPTLGPIPNLVSAYSFNEV